MTRTGPTQACNARELGDRLVRDGALDGVRIPWPDFTAEPIRIHASTREFYRLRPGHDRDGGSAVLVVYPEGGGSEVKRYLDTANWFGAAGVRVPGVLDAGTRALLVEDCGAVHLDDLALAPARRGRAYRQAVDAVILLQRYGRRAAPANPDLSLDREKLRWELGFMEEHALGAWLGVTRGASARERAYERLADRVAALPTAACHRDYHARNLLVLGNELVVVDFQDVMSGPYLYDLASCVWDNYCDVGYMIVGESLHRYWRASPLVAERRRRALAGAAPDLPPGLPARARHDFCLVALQRSLKALGTFGYQVAVAGNTDYARYVERTWCHARTALHALGWDDLEGALAAFGTAPGRS